MRTRCRTIKSKYRFQHIKPEHYVQHSKRVGKTPKPAQDRRQNCAMTVQRADSKVCYALVPDFIVQIGAQRPLTAFLVGVRLRCLLRGR